MSIEVVPRVARPDISEYSVHFENWIYLHPEIDLPNPGAKFRIEVLFDNVFKRQSIATDKFHFSLLGSERHI